MAFNKVILIGNITDDPELKVTTSGVNVTTFKLAVNRQGKDAPTDFFNIVAWRSTAEFVTKYFRKGAAILVCGKIQNRSWTDNNGEKHYATDIVADEVSFVGKASDNTAQPTKSEHNATQGATPRANFEDLSSEDELPF